MMKNLVFRHATGIRNYASVLSYLAGSTNCSTKPHSKLLTSILSAVKTGIHRYCDTSYSSGGVNQTWILKNSKDLLEYMESRSLCSFTSSSLSKILKSQIIKTIWEQLTQKPKQDSYDRIRVPMFEGDLHRF